MTKQDVIIKWSGYGIALLLVFIAQTMLLNRFTVFGVCPLLLPLAVVTVASHEGTTGGTGFGIAAGVLCDAAFYNTNGFYTIMLMLCGLIAGLVAEYLLSPGFLCCAACSLGALIGIDLIRGLYYIFSEKAIISAVLSIAVPEIVYSIVWLVPVYLIILSVYRRVGRTQRV